MMQSINKAMKSMVFPRFLKTLPVLLVPLLLIACEGPTAVENPFQGNDSQSRLSPPARDEQVRAFELSVWNNLSAQNRCGQCHSAEGQQQPLFADISDVNASYDALVGYSPTLVTLDDPSASLLVTKVGDGHNCWEQFASVCAGSLSRMISSWAGGSGDSASAREIKLTAPAIKSPGDSKTFPSNATDNDAASFANTLHPLLVQHCAGCHYEEGDQQQQSPFFANPDAASAYEAVKPKINIDLPLDSRLVQRLLENHNCWSDCGSHDATTGVATGNAGEMLAAIEQFADGIQPTQIDPELITSKALVLLQDGIVASGGNRHEASQIAAWEFKVGTGNTAFDTSGIEPAMNLTLEGDGYEWVGGYGIDFKGGKAQADTTTSKKLHDLIKLTGEYSIEAWVIPANVTQEDANIISYSPGSRSNNFALSQNLYNYNFYNRSDQSDANGEPALKTPDADEVLQSSLQHVVATYDPIDGRKLYVNGELIDVADPVTGSTSISNWDPGYAFILGQSDLNKTWQGKIRMAAIHNAALSGEQVKQNFDVGVGQKYFLLFSIADQVGVPDSYIRFEVSQFDSYSYLFDKPTFINLDADWVPSSSFSIRKMRIGINGKEAIAGQSFGYMDATVDAGSYDAGGQQLSAHGAVIALEKGADSDEFFLTFEYLAGQSNPHVDPVPTPPPAPADAEPVADIGVRTFDEINATIARITGIAVTNPKINALFLQYRQQLPTVESIDAFLSSHQMAIAQLALTSCSERVDIDAALPVGDSGRGLFTNFDFSASSAVAFNSQAKRDQLINPLLDAVLLVNVATQPDHADIADLLGALSNQTLTGTGGNALVDPDGVFTNPSYPSLITQLNTIDTQARTLQIAKAVCAAAVGSAAMLIQ